MAELHNEVNLDNLDESGFERLCAHVLERLGYGSQEHAQHHKGKGEDLRLGSVGNLVVVECRHCPGQTLGRPVLQRLHSAAVASHAKMAMVITTGKFAGTALEYAKEISNPTLEVRLIDLPILKDMAVRADINLVAGAQDRPIWMHKVSDDESFAQSFGEHMNKRYVSYPAKPSEMLTILDRTVELLSAYEVRYEIDVVFRTTIGVIHHEEVTNGVLLLNGTRGFVMKDCIGEFYQRFKPIQYSNEAIQQIGTTVAPFRVDETSAKKGAINEIVNRHTRRVTYMGGNGRIYEKMCQPKAKDITVTSIRQVYLPVSTTTFRMGRNEQTKTHIDHPSGEVMLLDSEMSKCSVCGQEVNATMPQLCNNCGAITHPKRFLSSHGVTCKDCGFTMCRPCATFIRRGILKAPFCKECAERRIQAKAKRKGSPPDSTKATMRKTRILKKS